jgi:hypothetical protein
VEALENVDIVAIASFVTLAVAWVILPLRAPVTSAAATPAVDRIETLESAA